MYRYEYNFCTTKKQSMEIFLKAYGKINIGLDVTGKREDGYHLLKAVFQTVGLYDEIRMNFEPEARTFVNKGLVHVDCKETEITVKTDNPNTPEGPGNLAYKAARLFFDRYKISGRLEIKIKKNIPQEAGMAGGSADAAAVLIGLREISGMDITPEDMDAMAVSLGADVPFSLRRGTWLGEGIGDIFTKLRPLTDGNIVIVKPDFGISTRRAFQMLDDMPEIPHPDMNKIISAIEEGDIVEAAGCMENILEIPALKIHPEISEIKNLLTACGAAGASMTGSGSAVFGIFKNRIDADEAKRQLLLKKYTNGVFLTEFIQ